MGVTAWLALRSGRMSGPEEAVADVPTDRLFALTAPEIRGGLALDGSGDIGFADAPRAPSYPAYVEGEISPGESLSAALVERGVPSSSLAVVIVSLDDVFDFRRSRSGDRFEVEMTSDGVITALRYQTSPEVVYEARLVGDRTYESRQVDVPIDVQVRTLSGTIESSLFGAVVDLGAREELARRFVQIFQWDIDFSRDMRPGDAFRILFEDVRLEGEFLRYGDVLAAEYRGARRSAVAFWFDEPGLEGYYTAEGEPLRRMFLVAPCNHRRISSRFDPDRMHPVLQRRAPHLGVDYAADTGTPVWAVADGEVISVGNRGRAGNLVRIRHDHGYETGYAHLHRFARGLREGDRVRQGQVIAYVGNTGLSTGPHLHLAMRRNGEHVDPLDERSSRGPSLSGRALRDFQRRQSQLLAQMSEVPIADVAPMEEPSEEPDQGAFVHSDYSGDDI